MNRLLFHPEAQAELISAINYYEGQNIGLGNIFLTEIENSIKKIEKNPTYWKVLAKEVRRYQVPRFPYSIFYIYLSDLIYIVAIAHNKRRPNYWKERFHDES